VRWLGKRSRFRKRAMPMSVYGDLGHGEGWGSGLGNGGGGEDDIGTGEVPCWRRSSAWLIKQVLARFCKDPLLLLPNTKDKERESCYSMISTRGVRGCWEGQGGGLVKFQINLD
jgi:hypothetical protein